MSCWSPSTRTNFSPLPLVSSDSSFIQCCEEYIRNEQLMQTFLFPKTSLNLIIWKLFQFRGLDKCNKENLRWMTNYSTSPYVTFKNNLMLNPLFVKTRIWVLHKKTWPHLTHQKWGIIMKKIIHWGAFITKLKMRHFLVQKTHSQA